MTVTAMTSDNLTPSQMIARRRRYFKVMAGIAAALSALSAAAGLLWGGDVGWLVLDVSFLLMVIAWIVIRLHPKWNRATGQIERSIDERDERISATADGWSLAGLGLAAALLDLSTVFVDIDVPVDVMAVAVVGWVVLVRLGMRWWLQRVM